MNAIVSGKGWTTALPGLVAVLFGVLIFVTPPTYPGSLVLRFGPFLLADSIFATRAGIRGLKQHDGWGGMIADGILDLLRGICSFFFAFVMLGACPGLSMGNIADVSGLWAIVTGTMLLPAALRLRRRGGRLVALSGLLSILWGAAAQYWTAAIALFLAPCIGAYVFLFGGLMIGTSFRQYRHA